MTDTKWSAGTRQLGIRDCVPVSELNCSKFKLDKSNAMLEKKMVLCWASSSDPIRSVGRQAVTNLVLNDVKIFIINHYQRCV